MSRTSFREHRASLAIAAVVAIAFGSYGLARSRHHDATPPVRSAAESGSAGAPSMLAMGEPSNAPSTTNGTITPTARAEAGTVDPQVAALRLGLASNEEATRIAAVEAAVSSTRIETLADLEKFDLARDPETAPTVIHAVALLGASAEGAKREEAANTLDRWLREESRRTGPDVPGNVSNLVEALGDVGGASAVDSLDAVLDRGTAALHVQTLAVMKLGELADPRARPSVERFARRVAALPAADGIDEELRVEAGQAAQATLSKL